MLFYSLPDRSDPLPSLPASKTKKAPFPPHFPFRHQAVAVRRIKLYKMTPSPCFSPPRFVPTASSASRNPAATRAQSDLLPFQDRGIYSTLSSSLPRILALLRYSTTIYAPHTLQYFFPPTPPPPRFACAAHSQRKTRQTHIHRSFKGARRRGVQGGERRRRRAAAAGNSRVDGSWGKRWPECKSVTGKKEAGFLRRAFLPLPLFEFPPVRKVKTCRLFRSSSSCIPQHGPIGTLSQLRGGKS